MTNPVPVGIIMGSDSDLPVMRAAQEVLDTFDVASDMQIVSAHRTPDKLFDYARSAESRGLRVIIAGAGGAAHLPGMAAAMTLLPVIAVPVSSKALNGMDSLLSIAQMPAGVAVATQAIGSAGAFNAGLMATQILALENTLLSEKLANWRRGMTEQVPMEVESCT